MHSRTLWPKQSAYWTTLALARGASKHAKHSGKNENKIVLGGVLLRLAIFLDRRLGNGLRRSLLLGLFLLFLGLGLLCLRLAPLQILLLSIDGVRILVRVSTVRTN